MGIRHSVLLAAVCCLCKGQGIDTTALDRYLQAQDPAFQVVQAARLP